MKKSTIILCLFLASCQVDGSVNVSKKHTETTTEFHEKTIVLSKKSKADNPWTGTWAFNDGYVDYSIEVSEDNSGRHRCVYHATGIQTYYVLECIGLVKGNSLQLINPTVKDGELLEKDRIGISDPILTLKIEKDGEVFTHWNKLNNNYPDNRDGKVCFKKG